MTTHDDIKLLKEISSSFPKINKYYKSNIIEGKTLYSLKESNKDIPLKQLNFNPISFISYKYSPKTLMLMDRKRNFLDKMSNNIKKNDNSNIKDNREYIYSMNTRKIKLKPLNKNRSSSQLLQRNDDILIPSKKTSQDLINYNMSNTHNTLLNYCHKNNTNLKIINFIRNPSDQNYISNSMDQNHSLSRSSTYLNINNESTNPLSNQYIKTNIENKKTSSGKKKVALKRSKSKKKIELMYEAEMFAKKLPHNLRFFADNLFKEDQNKQNKEKSTPSPQKTAKDFLESKQNSNINYQVIEFKGKDSLIATKLTNRNRKITTIKKNTKKEDFHHIMKNPFEGYSGNNSKINPLENGDLANKIQQLILNPNTSKLRNKKIWISNKVNNEIKSLSMKELRSLSNKGYEKMKTDKYKKFDLLVKNTSKEVIELEKKLDELLEINKKVFLEAKDELNL